MQMAKIKHNLYEDLVVFFIYVWNSWLQKDIGQFIGWVNFFHNKLH